MAKPGRKPTPTAIKKANGNPGKRPLNDQEPHAETYQRVPAPPAYLGKYAANAWKKNAHMLVKNGTLTKLDYHAFVAFCEAIGTNAEANAMIKAHGTLVKSPNGYPMPSPWVAIRNQAREAVRKWANEFGMTASSRSSIKIPKQKPKTPGADFLSGKPKPLAGVTGVIPMQRKK